MRERWKQRPSRSIVSFFPLVFSLPPGSALDPAAPQVIFSLLLIDIRLARGRLFRTSHLSTPSPASLAAIPNIFLNSVCAIHLAVIKNIKLSLK